MWNLDYSEYSNLIKKLEAMGANMNKVAEDVLNAGSEPARQAFARNVPRSSKEKEHAQDNVRCFPTTTSKKGTRYRVIKVGKSQKDRTFSYLFIVDTKQPFILKAQKDAHAAADPLMKAELERQVKEHIK
jgi:hypothetical protein